MVLNELVVYLRQLAECSRGHVIRQTGECRLVTIAATPVSDRTIRCCASKRTRPLSRMPQKRPDVSWLRDVSSKKRKWRRRGLRWGVLFQKRVVLASGESTEADQEFPRISASPM